LECFSIERVFLITVTFLGLLLQNLIITRSWNPMVDLNILLHMQLWILSANHTSTHYTL
jgi:hypothetical protein